MLACLEGVLAASDREHAGEHDDQQAEVAHAGTAAAARGRLALLRSGARARGAGLLDHGLGRTFANAVVGLGLGQGRDPGLGNIGFESSEVVVVDGIVGADLGRHCLEQCGFEADRVAGTLVGVRQVGQGVILATLHGHTDGVDADAARDNLVGVLDHQIGAATSFTIGDHQHLVAAGVHLVVTFFHETVGRILHGLAQGGAAVGAHSIHCEVEPTHVHRTQIVLEADVATVEHHEAHVGTLGHLGDHALEGALGHIHLAGGTLGVVGVGHGLVHGAGGVQDDHQAVVHLVRGQGRGREQEADREQTGEDMLVHDRPPLPVVAGVLVLDHDAANDGELDPPVVRRLGVGARQHDHGLTDTHTLNHELVRVHGDTLAVRVGQERVLGRAAATLGQGQCGVSELAGVVASFEGVEARVVEHLGDGLGALDVQGATFVEVGVVPLGAVARDLARSGTGLEHGHHSLERVRMTADRQGRGGVLLREVEQFVELVGVLAGIEGGLVRREAGREGQRGVVVDDPFLGHTLELATRGLGVDGHLAGHTLGLQTGEHGVIPVHVGDLDLETAGGQLELLGNGVGPVHEGCETLGVGRIHEVQVAGMPHEGRVAVETVGVLEGGVRVVVVDRVLHEGHVLVGARAVVRVHQVLDLLGRVHPGGREVAELVGMCLRPVGTDEVRVGDSASTIGRGHEHVGTDDRALGSVTGAVRTAGEGVHVRGDREGRGDVLVALEELDRRTGTREGVDPLDVDVAPLEAGVGEDRVQETHVWTTTLDGDGLLLELLEVGDAIANDQMVTGRPGHLEDELGAGAGIGLAELLGVHTHHHERATQERALAGLVVGELGGHVVAVDDAQVLPVLGTDGAVAGLIAASAVVRGVVTTPGDVRDLRALARHLAGTGHAGAGLGCALGRCSLLVAGVGTTVTGRSLLHAHTAGHEEAGQSQQWHQETESHGLPPSHPVGDFTYES